MKFVNENLWKTEENTMVIVTTNGMITQNKKAAFSAPRLVMGAFSAKEAVEKHNMLPYWAATAILDHCLALNLRSIDNLYTYGFLPILDGKLGIFQTKLHWQNLAVPELISYSVRGLVIYLEKYKDHGWEYRMPFPGIGLGGGLKPEQVEPLLEPLREFPVTICQFAGSSCSDTELFWHCSCGYAESTIRHNCTKCGKPRPATTNKRGKYEK